MERTTLQQDGKRKRKGMAIDYPGRLFAAAFILFLFCSFIASAAEGIGNIHFGSLEIHPFLNVTEGFVDNPYLARKGYEKTSGYRSYVPGVRCDWQKTKYRFQLSYLFEIFRYDIRDVDDKDLFDLDSAFDTQFGKSGHGLFVDGGYRYRKTSDPPTTEDRAENRRETDARLGVRLNMRDRFGIALNAGLVEHRYEDSSVADDRNRDVLTLTSKATLRPFTKTAILLEYGYTASDYCDPVQAVRSDSTTQSVLTGLEWEATAKLSGAIKGGYQWKEYNDASGTGDRMPETWKVAVDLKQTFSEFTSLTLAMERRIEDSTFLYAGREAEFYYSSMGRLGLDHQLTYKIGTWIDLSYTYSDYRNVPRKDEMYECRAGLDYQFLEWIWGTINGSMRQRNTNISEQDTLDSPDTYDYRTYQVNIGLNLVF
ncbi:MAG: outer membrane beta-barrel protein [bacterium]